MPNIHHELMIGAPAEEVYQAITSQEGLAAWWTPGAKATPEAGTIAHFPFGKGYFKEMKIVELQPPSLVKWVCLKGADEWIDTTLTFILIPGSRETLLQEHPEATDQLQQQQNGKGTLLTLHHDDWEEYTPMFAECNYTWGQFLRSLKLYCETGKGRPWPHQHGN